MSSTYLASVVRWFNGLSLVLRRQASFIAVQCYCTVLVLMRVALHTIDVLVRTPSTFMFVLFLIEYFHSYIWRIHLCCLSSET